MKTITLAIPYYRGKTLLRKACASVFAQTDANWRLIVSDDSPGSEGREVVAEFTDPRVSYHANPHRLGMVGNWNRCLDLAQTELVTLLHADDELLRGYVALMQTAEQVYPHAAALFCRTRIVDETGKAAFSFPDFFKRRLSPGKGPETLSGEQGLKALLRGNFLFCPTACIRKPLLGPLRFDSRWQFAQDLDVWTRLLVEGQTLVCLPETAYLYRRHGGNATAEYTRTALRFHEEFALYEDLEESSRRLGWFSAAKIARRASIVKWNILYCVLRDLVALQFRTAWEKTFLLFRGAFADRQTA